MSIPIICASPEHTPPSILVDSLYIVFFYKYIQKIPRLKIFNFNLYLYDMAQFGNISNTGKARISSPFGPRNIGPGRSKNHKGIDISFKSGTQLTSPLDGTVEKASPNVGKCGGFIMINHGNFNGKNVKTKYCHIKKFDVSTGDQIKQGQNIGLSGGGKSDPGRGNATGPHLHFEVLENGTAVNPESYYTNSISGEQIMTQLPGDTNTNDVDIDDSDVNDDKTSTGVKSYKEVARNLIKKLFGVESGTEVTPEVVNEIVEELNRYKELINEQVVVLDNASQSNANGGTIYTSTNTSSEIRVLPSGGNVEILTEKGGYQNAIRVGGQYDYFWNGTISVTNGKSISTGTVIGKTNDGKLFIKVSPKNNQSPQSVIPLKPGQTPTTPTTPATNPYIDSARRMAQNVLSTLVNGKTQAESVENKFDKILEEEIKNFKRLIR